MKGKLLLDHAGGDFRIRETPEIRDIVDWPCGERDNYEFGKVNLVPNCYHYGALPAMHGLPGNKFYLRRAAVRKAIPKSMRKNGLFTDNPDPAHTALHSAMSDIRFGVADSAEYPALASLIRAREMACSVCGAQFLPEACCRCGLGDHALNLLTSDTLRSWRNMLRKGATITMEAWDDSLKPNQDRNHAWGAAPADIIPRRLCGVRPEARGFQTFRLDPQTSSLSEVFLRQPTKHGPIQLQIRNGEIELSVPEGARCMYGKQILNPGKHVMKRQFPVSGRGSRAPSEEKASLLSMKVRPFPGSGKKS